MQDGLTIQGDLSDLPVPEILRSLLRNEGLCSVVISRHNYDYSLYLKNGQIVYGATTDPDLFLSTSLFKKGEFQLERLQSIMEEMGGAETEGRLLCDLDILAPDEFIRTVEQQIREILAACVNWRSGKYVMIFEDTLPEDGIMVKMDTDATILTMMRHMGAWSIMSRGLGGFRKLYRRTPNMDARFYNLDLSDDESHIYNLLESPHRMDEICQTSYLCDFDTLRALWALKVINLVEEVLSVEPEKKVTQDDEFTWSSLVENYNNAFSLFFGTVQNERGEDVYTFVDEMVGDLEEGVREKLKDCNPHNEGRLDFDILYNNLVASKVPNLTQAFQDILNEILYGWVFKIKGEFGDQYNELLDRAINSIHEE